MGLNSVTSSSYSVSTLTTQGSEHTNTNNKSGITLTSARNSRDMLESNSSKASTSSSGVFTLNMEGNSSNDSGIENSMTPKTVIRAVKEFNKEKMQTDIAKQQRESALMNPSSSSASDATESTPEIEEPKLKFNSEQLESAVTELTKKITELKKKAERIKTYEQYAKTFATFTDLATTVVLVGIAGTATGVTAIPLIIKCINLEKDLGNALLTHENSNRVNRDLPPLKNGTDFFEALGRTIGKWGGLSENNAVYKGKYFAKCTNGAMDTAATASTICAPVLSGALKNINWYTSIGRVMVNWLISTVIAKGDAKKEEAKHMEDVLKVVVKHQEIIRDIKNAETEQNHAETVEKLDEANRVLGETQIVVEKKTITITELISELTEKEKNLAESQTQYKTSEQLLADAMDKIEDLENYSSNLAIQLANNREQLMQAQADNISLQKKVTSANRFYDYNPSPETELRQRPRRNSMH
jgi:DNA repair exonuclease SbcCD ATPase subunit